MIKQQIGVSTRRGVARISTQALGPDALVVSADVTKPAELDDASYITEVELAVDGGRTQF
ncbi:hypothetical protein H6F76_00415 [Leptolyngbya sp. FACHB-321]|uniref:hypothetical protein n=1 Tax=Leptolyngbya sp. FACHB-321 TaxID=2692807 RepID=UPI001686FD67|nr:hypothetical protein [Leptolyngbya sp. FACHB-321]MBD2033528.1 hypothetical protein [Leptolyngbya sp. FACHB-321]